MLINTLAPGAKILPFGGSLTHGNGASTDQSYPALLGELLGAPGGQCWGSGRSVGRRT